MAGRGSVVRCEGSADVRRRSFPQFSGLPQFARVRRRPIPWLYVGCTAAARLVTTHEEQRAVGGISTGSSASVHRDTGGTGRADGLTRSLLLGEAHEGPVQLEVALPSRLDTNEPTTALPTVS